MLGLLLESKDENLKTINWEKSLTCQLVEQYLLYMSYLSLICKFHGALTFGFISARFVYPWLGRPITTVSVLCEQSFASRLVCVTLSSSYVWRVLLLCTGGM